MESTIGYRCDHCLHDGRCTVAGHERRKVYCSTECRANAKDEPHCSVDRCTGPADFTLGDSHRCKACAPGGCKNCWLWGPASCAVHRHVDAVAARKANRGHRPELKLLASTDLPVFTDPCVTCEGTGRLDNGTTCQLCAGAGTITPGEFVPTDCRPVFTPTDEDETKVTRLELVPVKVEVA